MKSILLFISTIFAFHVSFGQDSCIIPHTHVPKNDTTSYQVISPLNKDEIIGLSSIEVSYDMTTHLIFSFDILYVDLGNSDIVSQKAEKVNNILKLKANKKDFSPTNMTVVTTDGRYFSFMVYYAEFPKTLNINLFTYSGLPCSDINISTIKNQKGWYNMFTSIALTGDVHMNEGQINQYAYTIMEKKKSLFHIGEEKYHMDISIDNITIKDDVLFLSFSFENDSQVDYDIDFIKFFIRDEKLKKRTAQQELEVKPVQIFDPNRASNILGKSIVKKVFCFKRFTIFDNKVFEVELFEKNGGRTFIFSLSNEDLIRAKKI